ncbi:hypothetical protein [Micromonospora sp. NPDC049171]|uniref:hypothetical protein n=1 Tax=Micromonospora sp. NPDC049171 TaxID=3155770 RepID=UPI0033DC65FC
MSVDQPRQGRPHLVDNDAGDGVLHRLWDAGREVIRQRILDGPLRRVGEDTDGLVSKVQTGEVEGLAPASIDGVGFLVDVAETICSPDADKRWPWDSLVGAFSWV